MLCDISPYTDMYEAIKSVPIVRARTAYDNPETMNNKTTVRTLCFRRNMPEIHRAFGFSKASRTVEEEISRMIGGVSTDRNDDSSDEF